jgi:uncharacterized protein YbjT (DUF2867 family)
VAKTILVTGGVGVVGTQVVRRLFAAGQRVRATTHYPDPLAGTRAAAVDYIEVDYLSPSTLPPAFRDVGRLLLIVPESPDSVAATRNIIDAACDAGVSRIVKVSFFNAGTGRGGRLPEWHARAEAEVTAAGASWTILRPNLFMQNFATLYGPSIIARGAFRLPVGDGRVSYIDVRDVADVVVEALLTDDLEGRHVDLTGPAAVSHEEIADVLSRVLGRRIDYVDEAGSDARVCLERVGRAAELPAGLEELWEGVRAGEFAAVDPAVSDILGRPATDFETFAHDCRASFQTVP